MKSVFITILLIFSVSAKANNQCFYPSKKDGGNVSALDSCGQIKGDTIKLGKRHVENVVYDENGLACILFFGKSNSDAFYIQESGRSQRALFFDNGCDYFEEGLARGLVNGEMVFINKSLDVVLTPKFEKLMPYDYGHSIVCNGPFIEEKRGVHTLHKGGRCGLLNKQGNLVVEAKFKIEDRDVFRDYINANNHCPPPPVTSEISALCHAKRHVSHMKFHTTQWKQHQISKRGDVWLITFVEDSETNGEFTLVLNSSRASWMSIQMEPHNEALQRTSR